VSAKLFDQAQPVNVFLGCVMQHMKLYQAAPKVAMVAFLIDRHPRELISRYRK
jgi:hypothetical protein